MITLTNSMSKSVLHLDLHPIAKNGPALDAALREAIHTAVNKRLKAIAIIPGTGSGQLMKQVKKFLAQPGVKSTYKRIEVDSNTHGRLLVQFRQGVLFLDRWLEIIRLVYALRPVE